MEYVYKVVINKTKELFFFSAIETHQYLELPKVKVYYIKVPYDSYEFITAVYNNESISNINNSVEYLNDY